ATDQTGRSVTITRQYKVLGPEVLTATVNASPINGWYDHAVTVHITSSHGNAITAAIDNGTPQALSGGDLVVDTEGDHTVTYSTVESSTPSTLSVPVDLNNPTVSFTVPGAGIPDYHVGDTVLAG